MIKKFAVVCLGLSLIALAILWWLTQPIKLDVTGAQNQVAQLSKQQQIEQGEYLASIAGCIHCHTQNTHLAGGVSINTPFGDLSSPNISAHNEGIGHFSDTDFIRAVKYGQSPTGSHYYAAFPFTSFNGMSDADVLLIKRYLFSQPKVASQQQPNSLKWPFSMGLAATGWHTLNFRPQPFSVKARGEYLVEHVSHCKECHSARNTLGAITEPYANSPDFPGLTGLSEHYNFDDYALFLEMGMLTDGDFVGGKMTDVIDVNLLPLSNDDREAMVGYLLTL